MAALLKVPLGTTKTRIRLAMRRIAPAIALLASAGLLVFLWRRKEAETALDERALTMVTSSDVVVRHLRPVEGVPAETHANYRARPGGTVAILTASHLPPPPAGERYVGWVRRDAAWYPLGELHVRADGGALVLAEGPSFGLDADAIEITRESAFGSSPQGAPIVVWPSPP